MINTLYTLSLLIHIHTTQEPFPLRGTPRYESTIDRFFGQGLIEEKIKQDTEPYCHPYWTTTPLGAAWLKTILAVQPPVQRLAIDQDGEFGGWVEESVE